MPVQILLPFRWFVFRLSVKTVCCHTCSVAPVPVTQCLFRFYTCCVYIVNIMYKLYWSVVLFGRKNHQFTFDLVMFCNGLHMTCHFRWCAEIKKTCSLHLQPTFTCGMRYVCETCCWYYQKVSVCRYVMMISLSSYECVYL